MNEFRKRIEKNGFYNSPRITNEYPDCSLPFSFDSFSKCVDENAMISTPYYGKLDAELCERPAKELHVGDSVLTYNEKEKKYCINKILKRYEREVDEYIEITHREEGHEYTTLKVTLNHPILTQRNFVEASELCDDKDTIYCIESTVSPVQRMFSKRTVKGNLKTVNFTVDKNHNFFANGVLTHNCMMGCIYCFAAGFKSNNPAFKGMLPELKPVDTRRIKRMFTGKIPNNPYYNGFIKHSFPLQWGGLASPAGVIEKKSGVGLELIKFFSEMNYPVSFSMKGDAFIEPEYLEVFDNAQKNNFVFQLSIITNRQDFADKIELGVPSIERRLKVLETLSNLGYYTVLRLRPFIIGVSDIELDTLLERALKAGIKAVSMEFFCLDIRISDEMKKYRHGRLSEVIGTNIEEYYKALSPSSRGGYRRLNRDVKEKHIRKVYEFCLKHNLLFACSDPDFKELNTSGCCFSKDTEVIRKLKNVPRISRSTLETLYRLHKKKETKIKVSCNGEWKEAIPMRVEYRRMWYKIKLKNGIELTETDNHINLTERGNVFAKDLTVGDFMLVSNKKIPKTSDRGTYDLGKFVGLYIADGCCVYRKKGKFKFTFNQNEAEIITFIKNFVDELGGNATIEDVNRGKHKWCNVICYSIGISEIIKSYVEGKDAYEKKLKKYVYEMSENFRKGLLDGWMLGDGGKNKHNQFIGASTVSFNLANDMHILANTLGILTSIYTYTKHTAKAMNYIKDKNNVKPNYFLQINTVKIGNKVIRNKIKYKTNKIYRMKYHEINNKTYTQVISIERSYDKKTDYAYCLTVPDGHIFELANGIITHNCCGISETPNKILTEGSPMLNWSKSQWTYMIKEARKNYWRGNETKLYFKDLFNHPEYNHAWYNETGYYGDSLKIFGAKSSCERKNMNFMQEFRQTWNNIRSPSNPYNYFNGKLVPIGKDKDKNLIFTYVPSDYEKRWQEEGVDLKK